MKEVYIVAAVRTPIGSFGGTLSTVPAPRLGAAAIKAALEKAGVKPEAVNEVFMGNVLQAGVGQAPVTQASIFAGIPDTTPGTTINKVCASGMKAVMLGAQSIMLGINNVVVAGGMESMSLTPYYMDKGRNGYKYGHGQILDGIVKDGLWDVYNEYLMGNAAELTAKEYNITREEQDAFAIESYKRSADAWANGRFTEEVAPVTVEGKVPVTVSEDEEYKKVHFDKIPGLRPVFQKDGTVTAANASSLNDGASALILVSKEKAEELGLKPIAKIRGFADAQQAPEWFTTAPAKAIPIAIANAGLTAADIEFYEINEAFSAVGIANNKLLNLDPTKVNVNGGAVGLGHPLGSSGSRILVTLLHVLKQRNAKIGVAGICNGGGGASAIVVEMV